MSMKYCVEVERNVVKTDANSGLLRASAMRSFRTFPMRAGFVPDVSITTKLNPPVEPIPGIVGGLMFMTIASGIT
ncbi:hypothetical protein SDC9_193643 [bioreactor metagenome]|uniref:Uncharacterized protein n=1 Tax=bioreactor metagenome TaxID=1076179 RepID=A0A645IFB6_9ZZZZ